jgi:hypothetical protein
MLTNLKVQGREKESENTGMLHALLTFHFRVRSPSFSCTAALCLGLVTHSLATLAIKMCHSNFNPSGKPRKASDNNTKNTFEKQLPFLVFSQKLLISKSSYHNWTGCWASHSWWRWSGKGLQPSYRSPWSRTTAGAESYSHQHWPTSRTQTCKVKSKIEELSGKSLK